MKAELARLPGEGRLIPRPNAIPLKRGADRRGLAAVENPTTPSGGRRSPSQHATRVVIIGGGFAGVKCAATLRKALPSAEVVLFNIENHIVFTPLLAEVVGSSINPLDVVVPLRQLLPGVFCRTEEITRVDTALHEVEFAGQNGRRARLHYDQLVFACGNVPNLSVVPGMADHAFPLKSIGDAVALRSHVIEQLERAETCDDPVRRRWHLSFVVVGGGYSGVEAAGEINDLVRAGARYFKNFRVSDVSVTLIHSHEYLLPEIGTELRHFARRQMERRGVRIVLNTRVTSASVEGVTLGTGRIVRGGTIVCTVGSSPSPLIEGFAALKEKGRLVTDADMRVRGFRNIWAIGDCAHIINAHDNLPSAPTGQFAEREGRQCGANIVRALHGEQTLSFSFQPLGQLCSIGGHAAVAEMFGVRLSGFAAWLLWRGVYLFKLPTWGRRLHVCADWAWHLLFPRDLAHARTRQTDRVGRVHYQAGDIIVRHDEIPVNLLVIHRGEVEVLRTSEDGDATEVVGVFGPGAFVGERAFFNREPSGVVLRARTPVELMVMGRNVLTQLSASLTPLRDALNATLRRRAVDFWKVRPEALAILNRASVRDLMDPLPKVLRPTSTLDDVGRAFAESDSEFLLVSREDRTLEGVVTMTDLARAGSAGAHPATAVTEFMTRQPVTIADSDNAALAATVLREHSLKYLPIVEGRNHRRVIGVLRARRLMAHVYATQEKVAA